MNLEETISIHSLTSFQKERLIIWSYDMGKHAIMFPRKIWWFMYKNVPIVDEEQKPLTFDKLGDAITAITHLKKI